MAAIESEFKRAQGFLPVAGRALSFIAKLIFAGVMAYGVAQYRAGESEAQTDARIVAVEQKVTTIDSQIVPRREHEAHWKAIEEAQRVTQTDVREIRDTERQILLKLTK
jgi:hypothetical protein